MVQITEEEYEKLPSDYKSVWTSDDIHGTNYNGKRTKLHWDNEHGTVLLIEGVSFEIIKKENNVRDL